MRYFCLQQDLRRESGLATYGVDDKMREAIRGNLSVLDNLTVVKARTNKGRYFSELLSDQVFMYKNSVKEVFDLYEPSLEYKDFCIIDLENDNYVQYYSAPILKRVSALSPKSERSFNSTDKLYLDKRAVEELDGPDIFRLDDLDDLHISRDKCIVVSLAVAESLMRRKISKILLTHLELV